MKPSNHSTAQVTMRVIQGKWRLPILRLLQDGPQRTGQLVRGLDGVAKNRLNENMRELLRMGIVTKRSSRGRIPRVEYFLTPCGASLTEAIQGLYDWGVRHGVQIPRRTGYAST